MNQTHCSVVFLPGFSLPRAMQAALQQWSLQPCLICLDPNLCEIKSTGGCTVEIFDLGMCWHPVTYVCACANRKVKLGKYPACLLLLVQNGLRGFSSDILKRAAPSSIGQTLKFTPIEPEQKAAHLNFSIQKWKHCAVECFWESVSVNASADPGTGTECSDGSLQFLQLVKSSAKTQGKTDFVLLLQLCWWRWWDDAVQLLTQSTTFLALSFQEEEPVWSFVFSLKTLP